MIGAARWGAIALAASTCTACAEPRAKTVPPPPPAATPPLPRLAELAPAASLEWLAVLRPRALLAHPGARRALETVVDARRFAAFAAHHGGVDPRDLDELVVARYPDTTLALARGDFEPAAVEHAFSQLAFPVDGRAVDRDGPPETQIVRTWGGPATDRQQLVTFGRAALGVEWGQFGPLRSAQFFAQGRLRKARSALQAEPLAEAAAWGGDGDARWFAAGPFDGGWGRAAGGLLATARAIAVRVRIDDPPTSKPSRDGRDGADAPSQGHAREATLSVRVALLGDWGSADAGDGGDGGAERSFEAARAVRAAVADLAGSLLGRLAGLHDPVEPVRVEAWRGAVVVETVLDLATLARGLHAALDGDAREIVRP